MTNRLACSTPSALPISGAAHTELLTRKATLHRVAVRGDTAPPAPDAEYLSTEENALADIVEKHRRRCDIARARQRLVLQAMSFCRGCADEDKSAGAKLWKEVLGDEGHDLRPSLWPYLAAIEPLAKGQKQLEQALVCRVRELPIHGWAAAIKGLGDLSLAAIIGECVEPIGSYKSVAAVWKRMGLALVAGERQQRVCGPAALVHGYSPERRALMWNIGVSLIRAQVRSDPMSDRRFATGGYGQVYLDRKIYEVSKPEITPAHAHRRAQRYMEKRVLRDLYREWNRSQGAVG